MLESIVLIMGISCIGKKSGIDISKQPIQMLIRCDDIGMCHSVNMAMLKLIDAGIPFSASVMFVCPWYQEAVSILKDHPEISIGVHLCLNAEWKNFRWGPISGNSGAPSLTDSLGYFFPSSVLTYAHLPKIQEIELELRQQIKRAFDSGLKIDYLDTHMSTISQKEEYRNLVRNLALEYGLGLSRNYGEKDAPIIYSVPVENKADSLQKITAQLQPGQRWLLVCHIGLDSEEMQAMLDMNEIGLKFMSRHRQAELNALLHPRFTQTLLQKNINLVTYRNLAQNHHTFREDSVK